MTSTHATLELMSWHFEMVPEDVILGRSIEHNGSISGLPIVMLWHSK